jgi:hypothetical protein
MNDPVVSVLTNIDSQEKQTDESRHEIHRALQLILRSPSFRNSERCKQFLKYVVENSIEGQSELLKERLIGIEVFGLPADYETGDHPIVRVQAGEVRKRLQQYYDASETTLPVQIELPTGSYAAHFRFAKEAKVPFKPLTPSSVPEVGPLKKTAFSRVLIIVILVFASFSACIAFYMHWMQPARSDLDKFWSPAYTFKGPILICFAQPVVYVPGNSLFQRFQSRDPHAFQSFTDRKTKPLPLKSDEQIIWGDMALSPDQGLAAGDVYAAQRITAFLEENHKKTQTRIGNDYTFEDLRNSPSVLIGAVDNKWSIQLTSKLRFAFLETDPAGIVEQIPGGRQWHNAFDQRGRLLQDHAIIARLLDSETGQFTIIVAGVWASGTQAGAEFVTDNAVLSQALKTAPQGWEKRNLEIVLETDVTDLISSPPRVVAAYFW